MVNGAGNSNLQMPERILDAPELVNDYYLNLLDWSADNRLAVALGADVYLWNAGKITKMIRFSAEILFLEHVCSTLRHTSNQVCGFSMM